MKNAHRNVIRTGWVGLALAAALSLASCATHIEIPLEWRPTKPAAEIQSTMSKVDLAGAKVQFMKLEDARQNKAQIGGEPDAKEPKSVTTRDDVGAFVAKQLAENLALLTPGSGLQIVDKDPAVIVSGKVEEFYVTSARVYEGVVKVTLTVKKPDGTQLYMGTTSGKSSRFAPIGFKGENFQEGYSDALLVVAKGLAEAPGFRKALKGEAP